MQLKFHKALLEKYNISGPRYTSYPTAPHFHSNINISDWENALQKSNNSQHNLSLYIHLPFCHSLCYFCGCTMRVTKNKQLIEKYLASIINEMKLVSEKIGEQRKVTQIHFGGGTPNFLSQRQLLNLDDAIKSKFNLSENLEYSCEIDPRSFSNDHLYAFVKMGINRVSIGIQDFNKNVQVSINRINSFEVVKKIVNVLQNYGIESINFDLIYGLPLQTIETFSDTLNNIITLTPSRLAVYNFAYVPWVKPHQKIINKNDLPLPNKKLAILQMTIDKLRSHGYEYIGMDHFAKSNDELTQAQKKGILHRNFQGYTTQSNVDLLGFGISAISTFGNAYFQNEKGFKNYFHSIQKNKLPIEKGLILSPEDIQNGIVINRLMCDMKIDYKKVSKLIEKDFKIEFKTEIEKIQDRYANDGIVQFHRDGFDVTDIGRFFVRNIAMTFDKYLNNENSVYSNTI